MRLDYRGLNRRRFDWRGLATAKGRVVAVGVGLLAVAAAVLVSGSHFRAATGAAELSYATADGSLALQQILDGKAAGKAKVSTSHIASAQAQAILAGLPLMFEPNQGQANLDPTDPNVKFLARGSGYSLLLGPEGAILNLRSHEVSKHDLSKHDPSELAAKKVAGAADTQIVKTEQLQMKLAGANPQVALSAGDPLPGKTNYILGNDPSKWRSDVPQFAQVRYENVYPGINLVFYGNQGRLEYDFQVAPGSDPEQAELEFSGEQSLKLKDGALVVESKGGSVRFDAPRVYQQIAGRQQAVEGSFVLRGKHRAGFAIGPYDRSRELVIDPVLLYSTYFGGSQDETATSVAVQGGYIYLSGATDSPNLPVTSNVYQTSLNGAQNVYLAQIDPTLGTSGLIYLTYLGGNGSDTPVGVGVDGSGNIYVSGTTTSTNFPHSADAYQPTIYANSTGTQHAFVSRINPTAPPPATAQLIYSSYLSGSGDDVATGMTIDSAGHIFITGTTTSSNPGASGNPNIQFPVSTLPTIPFQSTFQSSVQFFVTEVSTTNATGAGSIAYSTYFGGANTASSSSAVAQGGGIAVDANDNIYFTGTTNFIYQGNTAGDFPILNAYQPCLDTPPPTSIQNPPICTYSGTNFGNTDAFVAKLNPQPLPGQQELQFSTYLGGSQNDSGVGIALDSAANVYIVGTTYSPDFVPSSTVVSFAPYQLCLDNEYTGTPPTVTCSATAGAPSDAFVAKLSNPASGATTTNVSLTYFSYLGGSNEEQGLAIAVDTAGGALITGLTQSTAANPPVTPVPSGDFPVASCAEIQCELAGTQDAFVARINTQVNQNGTQNNLATWVSYFGGGIPSNAMTQGTSITLDVNQNSYFAGNTNSTDLEVAGAYQPCLDNLVNPTTGACDATPPAPYDAFVTQLGSASNIGITGVLSLGNNQTFVSAGSQATFIYTVTNGGPDLASDLTVTDFLINNGSGGGGTGVTLTPNSITSTAGPGTCSSISTNATEIGCFIQTLQAGATVTITMVLTPSGTSKDIAEGFNGGTVLVTGPNNIELAHAQVAGQMSDYSLALSPNNVTLQTAGDTAVYQVQLSPFPIYSSNISLSCQLPATATTCTFTTPTVTLAGASPGSSTMNVTTTARPVTPPVSSLWTRHFYAIWLSLPGVGLLGLGAGSNRRRRHMAGLFLLCALTMILFLPACRGTVEQTPVAGTPAGTYTITVTATSGTDTKNETATLIVP